MTHRHLARIAFALLLALGAARADEPVETRTLFEGALAAPAPPLALAVRNLGEVERLIAQVQLPAPVLEELRAIDFTRSIVVAVTGDPGVKVERATRDPLSRSLLVTATRSAPHPRVRAIHLVRLGDSRGLTQGVRDAPADSPLGVNAPDPWAGWTIELALGERWQPETITGTVTFGEETLLHGAGGETWRLAIDPRLAGVVPPAQRTWDPKAGLPVELECEVDRTVWMVRNIRRVSFPGTPWAAVRATARGSASRQGQLAPDAGGALLLPDCSQLTLIGWEAPAREAPMMVRGFLLERAGSVDGRFLVLEATPLERQPDRREMLEIDGRRVVDAEPTPSRGPVDRALGED